MGEDSGMITGKLSMGADDSPAPANDTVNRVRDEVMRDRAWHLEQVDKLEAELEKAQMHFRERIAHHHSEAETLTQFMAANQMERPMPTAPSRGY